MGFDVVSVATWLGIGFSYVAAAALVGLGLYLAVLFNLAATNPLSWIVRPLRFVGYAMVGCGLMMAAFTYGKATGAADCTAAWKEKNYEAQIVRIRSELNAKKEAAEVAEQLAQSLATDNLYTQRKLDDAQAAVRNLPACRRATDDDDRRLCDIIGDDAPDCRHSE